MSLVDEYDIITVADVKQSLYLERAEKPFEDIAASFAVCIEKIVGNAYFCKEHFKRRDIFLCEAYCLLVNSVGLRDASKLLQVERQLKTGVYAAVLLDLYAAGVIDFYYDNKNKRLGERKLGLCIRPTDSNSSFTFMNDIAFKHLFLHYDFSREINQSVSDWLTSAQNSSCATTAIMNNLVARGILSRTECMVQENFFTYRVMNFWPGQELEREIISTGLRELKPDSFLLSLLTLSHVCDMDFISIRLDKFFKGRENSVAKENIRTIVETQGHVLKSPKFIRKKFSFEVSP